MTGVNVKDIFSSIVPNVKLISMCTKSPNGMQVVASLKIPPLISLLEQSPEVKQTERGFQALMLRER